MNFRYYTLKDLVTSTISELLLTANMLKCLKHLWNLQENTFMIFFHPPEGK